MYEFGSIDLRPYLDDLKNEKEEPWYKNLDEPPKLKEQVLDFGFRQENTSKFSIKKKIRIFLLEEEELNKNKTVENTKKINFSKKTSEKR